MYYVERVPKLSSSEILDVLDCVPLRIRSYEVSSYIKYVDEERSLVKLTFPEKALAVNGIASVSVKVKVEIPPKEDEVGQPNYDFGSELLERTRVG